MNGVHKVPNVAVDVQMGDQRVGGAWEAHVERTIGLLLGDW